MRRYTVLILPEEGIYTALVPTLPGCATQGDTIEEALENAREAIAVYLEALEARGEPIPEETGVTALAAVEV